MKADGRFGFALAWKARRAEIEVLADRAQAKKHEGRRVEVILDTTAFREYPAGERHGDNAAEHALQKHGLGGQWVAKDLVNGYGAN